MLRLLDVVIDSKYSFKEKVTFLKNCHHTDFFGDDNESVDLVSKKIKALLNTTNERTEGLLLLQIFLDECSTDAFIENALSWAHLTLKAIKGPTKGQEKALACKVFLQLIPLLPSFPSVSKQVSTSVVVSLFEAVIRVTPEDEWFEYGLDLLLCCLKTYPGFFGVHKVTIENFIIKHLGEWPQAILETLASCVSQLPWCSGGGVLGANHSSAWSTQLTTLLSSMEKIIDQLYNGTYIDEDGSPLLLSTLELPTSSDSDPLLAIYSLQKHFQFLGLCLQQMLNSHHSTAVKIPFSDLLTFIWNALSLNSQDMLDKPSLDALAVASAIPTIHCVTLSILETLITGYGRQLAIHTQTVNHLLKQTLNWTAKDSYSYGKEKPYSHLRVQTYRTLEAWMKILGPVSAVHEHSEAFIDHFLNDLRVESESVQLLSPSGQNRPHGRKRKRKQAEMIASSLSVQKKVNLFANTDVCLAALIGLKCILYSCGNLLDVDLHKRIHNVIVHTLLDIQQESQCGDFKTVLIPYFNARCRQELYAILLACVLCPHPEWPPPLQPSIAIFQQGRFDQNLKVSSFCTESLAIFNVIVHPNVAVLRYVEQQVEPQQTHHHHHSVSNRASNMIIDTSAPLDTRHIRPNSNLEDMEFASSYSQENLLHQAMISSDLKKDNMMWRGKENEQQTRPAMMDSSEKMSSMPGTIPLQQGTIVTQSKQNTVVTQHMKAHRPPPATTPSVAEQQQEQQQQQRQKSHPPHHGKGSMMQRGMPRAAATEEVVVLSGEESAEDNHMEEGMDEEEEDEEGEDEEEGEDYYPEEDEDEEYEGQVLKENAYYGDKSPSLVPTGGRSTEDSSSTGVAFAVSSIVGNLVSEAASNNTHMRGTPPVQKAKRTGAFARTAHSFDLEEGSSRQDDDSNGMMPVQKARRTGVLARTEHSADLDDQQMDEHQVEDYEEGEDIYEGEDEEEEEEDEEGDEALGAEGDVDEVLQGECEDDVEEIQQLEDQETGDGSQYQKWSEKQEETMLIEKVLISEEDNDQTAELVSSQIDQHQEGEEIEREEITTLQPVQFDPTTTEHSPESTLANQYEIEPQIVSTTTVDEMSINQPEEQLNELSSTDGQTKNHEQSGTDSDIIELSDSPQKEVMPVVNCETIEFRTVDIEPLVQNDEELIPEQISSEQQVIEEEEQVAESSVAEDGPKSDGTLQNETNSVANEMIVEEIYSPSNEQLNEVTENSVHNTNHSATGAGNCSPHVYAEEEEMEESTSSENRVQTKNIHHTIPDSPEEPSAKKMCIRIREQDEKESEPEEESPPVHIMLDSFVCREVE